MTGGRHDTKPIKKFCDDECMHELRDDVQKGQNRMTAVIVLMKADCKRCDTARDDINDDCTVTVQNELHSKDLQDCSMRMSDCENAHQKREINEARKKRQKHQQNQRNSDNDNDNEQGNAFVQQKNLDGKKCCVCDGKCHFANCHDNEQSHGQHDSNDNENNENENNDSNKINK